MPLFFSVMSLWLRFFRLHISNIWFGIVASFLASFFITITPAHAWLQQIEMGDNLTTGNATNMGMLWKTNGSADPNATSNQITSIEVRVKNGTGTTCNVNMRAYYSAANYISSDNIEAITANYQYLTFTFSSALLTEANLVKFYLNYSGVGGCALLSNYTPTYAGSSADVYPYADMWKVSPSTTSTSDVYFVINGGGSVVSFVDTPTNTCNFANWKINSYFNSSDLADCVNSNTCSVGVGYNANFSSTNTYQFNINYPVYNTIQLANPNDWYIPNSYTFVSGTVYDARAYICSDNVFANCFVGNGYNSRLLAYSDNWEFIANGLDTCTSTYYSQGEATPPNGTTSTAYNSLVNQANNSCLSYNDGSVIGGVVYGLCKSLVFLFVPSDGALNNFVQLKDQVAAKPPFGYVSIYGGQIADFSNVTNTSSTITTSTLINDIATFATNTPWYQTIKTAIGAFLWVIFGFAVWRFFKHFAY